MKYMGSKRWMLANGLGHILRDETQRTKRFVDLFAGSGAVSCFGAEKNRVTVNAYDLQSFSAALTDAVVSRTQLLNADSLWSSWERKAVKWLSNHSLISAASGPDVEYLTQTDVSQMRCLCTAYDELPIVQAYGGHYFSLKQAVWIEALRRTLPDDQQGKVALAALIQAASQCAAAPGHTAQPFQPTRTAKRFLTEAWARDLKTRTLAMLRTICSRRAQMKGSAEVADANCAVERLRKGDLVFVDPPYSGVHYSRFYHVLETIARGYCGSVTGVGRYPPASERPRSKYSIGSQSRGAIEDLLAQIARRGATGIVTFPDKKCSNGISGYLLKKLGLQYFRKTEHKIVRGRFSTLGGDGNHRDARQPSFELVLILRP
jgi:adenine-specific DNA-methyltransferase